MRHMAHQFTLPNITPPLLQRVLAVLRSEGTQVAENPAAPGEYMLSGQGIVAYVTLFGGQANVTIHDKPWLVPDALIEAKVRQAVERVRMAG